MLVYETIFRFTRPVAGEIEIRMVEGVVRFTRDNRCAVFSDGSRLVILDRILDRGIQMSPPGDLGWFGVELDQTRVKLTYHPRNANREIVEAFVIETEPPGDRLCVPVGWPGESRNLPV